MSCHGNNKKQDNKHLSKHMILMVLCCGLPVLLAVLLPALSLNQSLKHYVNAIIPFICPIGMILMLPMMFSHSKHEEHCSNDKND